MSTNSLCAILCVFLATAQSAKLGEIGNYMNNLKVDHYAKDDNEIQGDKKESLPFTSPGRFWHLSDLHLDFYYDETAQGSNVCPSSYGVPPIDPGPYGDYRCDSPWKLINSSIYAMKEIYPEPDFVLWTGDDTLHTSDENRYLSEDLVLETIENMTLLIQKVFPNIKVYSALGNHDVHPKNQMPIGSTSFLTRVADIWKDWLLPVEKYSFLEGGYYKATDEKFPNLQVVVLNTNLWYSNNKAFNATAEEDPGGQFEFLRSTLENADVDAKIYIIGHIPPGYFELVDGVSWLYPQYSAKYIELVKQYSDRIAGQFFGHHHTDSFRIFNDDAGNTVSSMWLAPGVTPWMTTLPGVEDGANNPGIRLFDFDKSTLKPTDYRQYYMDLERANILRTTDWKLEYRATTDYEIPDIGPNNMATVFRRLKAADPSCTDCKDTQLLNKYSLYNSVSYNKKTCNSVCQSYHVCAISELQAEGYENCIGNSANRLHSEKRWRLIITISILALLKLR